MSEPDLKLFVHQTLKGERWIYAHFQNETVWLTLEQIADLFNIQSDDVLGSLEKLYIDNDLRESKVSKNFSISDYKNFCKSEEGKEQKYYNLDVILAIGYQRNVKTATEFRHWSSTEIQNSQVDNAFQNVFHNYLVQIVFNFILAIIVALIIRFFIDESIKISIAIASITLLIGMYNISFDAIRYNMIHGFWRFKSKSNKD